MKSTEIVRFEKLKIYYTSLLCEGNKNIISIFDKNRPCFRRNNLELKMEMPFLWVHFKHSTMSDNWDILVK